MPSPPSVAAEAVAQFARALGAHDRDVVLPRGAVVLAAYRGCRHAMEQAGLEPDHPSLRHARLLLDLRRAPRAGLDHHAEVRSVATGRLGHGTGLVTRVAVFEHGDPSPLAEVRATLRHDGTGGAIDDRAAIRPDRVPTPPIPSATAHVEPLTVPGDVVADYLRWSGDEVQIHHDPVVAAGQGLDGPVVPGFLLAALVAARLEDPGTTGSMTMRFRRPALVGAVLTLRSAPAPGSPAPRGFELLDGSGAVAASGGLAPPG